MRVIGPHIDMSLSVLGAAYSLDWGRRRAAARNSGNERMHWILGLLGPLRTPDIIESRTILEQNWNRGRPVAWPSKRYMLLNMRGPAGDIVEEEL